MAAIGTGQDVVTLVNVFTVSPDRQRQLAGLLAEATRTTMNRMPGCVPASIHRSLDGTKVVSCARWRRAAGFEAMLGDPAAQPHMTAAAQLATGVEPHRYEVVFTGQAATPPRP